MSAESASPELTQDLPPELERLRSHFATTDPVKYSGQWEHLWQDGTFLPWDRGEPSPPLVDVVTQRQDLVGSAVAAPGQSQSSDKPRRKALIPGCGMGYDCYMLQAQGWDVVGLDISETAVKRARAYQDHLGGLDVFTAGQFGKGSLKFECGDFFTLDGEVWMGKWDLIWDYTFLCALPPDMRPKWALQMSRLLSSTGRLICNEFPTLKDPRTRGPPWGVSSELYIAILSRPGSDVKYDEEQKILPEDQQSPRNENALTRIIHFKPERAFAAGRGSDRISIWAKQ